DVYKRQLLQRAPERTGLLAACRELGVTLIAYSPLEQGLLSGKYGPHNPPPGLRGRRYRAAYLARIQPVIERLRAVGERYGKTPNQVALNWLICKGAVPIPGAKNARQVHENAGALGWRLNAEEIAALDEVTAAL
ncbi:MAG: aldo/keto reductase, partial [Anaerolineae bacterium]|nr:aldo/keto reductase [Anaerolineae bacterium]